MQFAIELQILDHLTPVGFERRSKIMEIDTADFREQPIRDAARQLPREPRIAALVTPAAHHIESFIQLRDEPRDLCRIVLEIAIH